MKMIVMIMLIKFDTDLKPYTEVIRYLLQIYTYLGIKSIYSMNNQHVITIKNDVTEH